MLSWNIKTMLATKGILKPYAWLTKHGISHALAHQLLANKAKRVELKSLYKICAAAYCTPNDLLAYTPTKTEIITDKHPLQALRAAAISQLGTKLQKMTPAQIAALEKLADEME